ADPRSPGPGDRLPDGGEHHRRVGDEQRELATAHLPWPSKNARPWVTRYASPRAGFFMGCSVLEGSNPAKTRARVGGVPRPARPHEQIACAARGIREVSDRVVAGAQLERR